MSSSNKVLTLSGLKLLLTLSPVRVHILSLQTSPLGYHGDFSTILFFGMGNIS